MLYGTFDSDGNPTGFYTDEIHATFPYDAVEISREDWQHYANEQGKWRRNPSTGMREEIPAQMKTPADLKAEKKAAVAKLRYEKETGGISASGVLVKTDRESQAMLTGAWVRVQQEPTALIDWKADSGWVQIGKPTVESLAVAVGAHVQACFTAEKSHSEAIEALPDTVAAIEAYDITIGWPL